MSSLTIDAPLQVIPVPRKFSLYVITARARAPSQVYCSLGSTLDFFKPCVELTRIPTDTSVCALPLCKQCFPPVIVELVS